MGNVQPAANLANKQEAAEGVAGVAAVAASRVGRLLLNHSAAIKLATGDWRLATGYGQVVAKSCGWLLGNTLGQVSLTLSELKAVPRSSCSDELHCLLVSQALASLVIPVDNYEGRAIKSHYILSRPIAFGQLTVSVGPGRVGLGCVGSPFPEFMRWPGQKPNMRII